MAEAARDREPILVAIFIFDVISYTIRLLARAANHGVASLPQYLTAIAPQLLNMVLLYTAIYFINQRSRRQAMKPWAAIQVRSSACSAMHVMTCMYMCDGPCSWAPSPVQYSFFKSVFELSLMDNP